LAKKSQHAGLAFYRMGNGLSARIIQYGRLLDQGRPTDVTDIRYTHPRVPEDADNPIRVCAADPMPFP
jgi:hypothetical protein